MAGALERWMCGELLGRIWEKVVGWSGGNCKGKVLRCSWLQVMFQGRLGGGMAGERCWGMTEFLGEFGEGIGRRMKAGKGVGQLEIEEGVLLKVSAGKGKGIGWRRLWDWSLSPGRRGDSQTTLSGHSLFWKWRRQRRKGMSCRGENCEGKGSLELDSTLGSSLSSL